MTATTTLTKTQRDRKRAMVRASERHKELLQVLGGACAMLDDEVCEGPLQIDHVEPRKIPNHHPSHRRKRWDDRVRDYWREYEAGVKLQALCKYHNGAKKDHRQDHEESPF